MTKTTKHPFSIETKDDIEALNDSLDQIEREGEFRPLDEVLREISKKVGLDRPEGTLPGA